MKSSISLPPDYSVLQLKEKICEETNVPPDEQILYCNGMMLGVSDLVTLKQARIPNGSKIKCIKVNRTVTNKQLSVEDVEMDESLVKLENIENKTNELEKCVLAVDKERRELNEEFKKLRLECGKNGEQLMNLLESLDQLHFRESQGEQRFKRKNLATLLNSILDKNDKIVDKLTSAINNCV